MNKLRFCLFCHQVGMMVDFPNGNALRKHVRIKHPRTKEQLRADKNRLRLYRRDVLLVQARLGVRKTT